MDTVALTTPLAPIAAKENFIERFGDWISGLFGHAETVYQQLEDEAKKAAVWGSGIISVLNLTIGKTPEVVKQLFQAKFPELSFDVIQGFLDRLQQRFDSASNNIALTLDQAIQWAQGWLASHKDDNSAWGIISSAASNFLSILFSPGTAIEKFISIGVYVYHMIVKPHVEAPLPAPVQEQAVDPAGASPVAILPDGSTVAVGSDAWNAAVEAEVNKRLATREQAVDSNGASKLQNL